MRLIIKEAPAVYPLLLVLGALPNLLASATLTYDLVVSDDPADIGQVVTATATTDDPAITHVRFIWKNSKGIVVRHFNVPCAVCPAGSSPFEDSFAVNEIGEWTVFAQFIDKDGGIPFAIVRKLYVHFLVVPEFPFGSIVAVAAIFGAVLVYGKIMV